jgi:ribosomal protein S18 acetylase RimI-like enzyme
VICSDALKARGPVIVSGDGGVVLALINGPRYWRNLFVRHPAVGIQLAVRHFSKHFKRSQSSCGIGTRTNATSLPTASEIGFNWKTEDPSIAKIILVAVEPHFRRQGVATRLYGQVFESLADLGVTSVIARIEFENTASVALHQSTGWVVGSDEISWIARKDLK